MWSLAGLCQPCVVGVEPKMEPRETIPEEGPEEAAVAAETLLTVLAPRARLASPLDAAPKLNLSQLSPLPHRACRNLSRRAGRTRRVHRRSRLSRRGRPRSPPRSAAPSDRFGRVHRCTTWTICATSDIQLLSQAELFPARQPSRGRRFAARSS